MDAVEDQLIILNSRPKQLDLPELLQERKFKSSQLCLPLGHAILSPAMSDFSSILCEEHQYVCLSPSKFVQS